MDFLFIIYVIKLLQKNIWRAFFTLMNENLNVHECRANNFYLFVSLRSKII